MFIAGLCQSRFTELIGWYFTHLIPKLVQDFACWDISPTSNIRGAVEHIVFLILMIRVWEDLTQKFIIVKKHDAG